MGATKRVGEQLLLGTRPRGQGVLRRTFRQRARQQGQRHSDLQPADSGRGSGHCDRPAYDAVLHERGGGGPARPAVRRPGRARGRLHARDGRARVDPGHGQADDPACQGCTRGRTSRSASSARGSARSCTSSCTARASASSPPNTPPFSVSSGRSLTAQGSDRLEIGLAELSLAVTDRNEVRSRRCPLRHGGRGRARALLSLRERGRRSTPSAWAGSSAGAEGGRRRNPGMTPEELLVAIAGHGLHPSARRSHRAAVGIGVLAGAAAVARVEACCSASLCRRLTVARSRSPRSSASI